MVHLLELMLIQKLSSHVQKFNEKKLPIQFLIPYVNEAQKQVVKFSGVI
jgi:hypothetical protein